MLSDQNTTLPALGADLRPAQPERHIPLTTQPDGTIGRAKWSMDDDGNWQTVQTTTRRNLAGELEALIDGTQLGGANYRDRLRRRAGLANGSAEEPFLAEAL